MAKNPITGEGIPYLARLPRLEWIDLSWTKVDDAHLAGLAGLMALRRIDLTNNPQVHGSFLRNVVVLPHLETLVLRHSAITDESLDYLKDAVSLQSLMIDSTVVTNAGLPYLAMIPTLRDIDLSNTAVTRTALSVLAEQKGLTSVASVITKSAGNPGGIWPQNCPRCPFGIEPSGWRSVHISCSCTRTNSDRNSIWRPSTRCVVWRTRYECFRCRRLTEHDLGTSHLSWSR